MIRTNSDKSFQKQILKEEENSEKQDSKKKFGQSQAGPKGPKEARCAQRRSVGPPARSRVPEGP